jgi:pSer/pThr/pTyr-binding forkhead associated (FHA) protein
MENRAMGATDVPFGPHSASAAELKEQLDAERRGKPFLVFRDGDGAQRIVVLDDALPTLTIGRAPETDVCLGWDSEVSSVHAELARVGPDWTISDDGLSRNGTFVNGARVPGRTRLRGGDVIRVGSTAVAFRGAGTPLAATADVPTSAAVPLSPAQRRVLVALCRPYRGGAPHAVPTSNREIGEELFLSTEGVKTHVRTLFERFGVEDLPQNRKRARLIELAFSTGTITDHDFA